MAGSAADPELVLAAFRARGWRLATAESCTGGLVCGRLTDIAGSSDVVEGGVVVYDNRAKRQWLGVDADLLQREGAVSESVARAMAEGCRRAFAVDAAIAVTGIAGPGGATATKPVGIVHLVVATVGETRHLACVFPGDRAQVRAATVEAALTLLASAARGSEIT